MKTAPGSSKPLRGERLPALVNRGRRSPCGLFLVLLGAFVFAGLLAGQTAPGPAQEPVSVEELFQKGVQALKNGRLDEAEKAFQQVLAAPQGDSGFVRQNLGIVYQQRGEHAKAVEQFRKAIEWPPDEPGSHALLGVSLLALSKTQQAVEQLEKAVALGPNQPDLRLQLALAYERAGDAPKVVAQFRALRRLDPKDSETAYRLGKAYIDLAAWSTRKMIEAAPQSPRVYQLVGENYFMQGNLALAERNLSRAAELGPTVPGVHWSLAQVYVRKGDKQAALRELDRELAAMPGSLMALRLKQQLEKQP
jgi:tetratricopeptide (TPR) repeat protein